MLQSNRMVLQQVRDRPVGSTVKTAECWRRMVPKSAPRPQRGLTRRLERPALGAKFLPHCAYHLQHAIGAIFRRRLHQSRPPATLPTPHRRLRRPLPSLRSFPPSRTGRSYWSPPCPQFWKRRPRSPRQCHCHSLRESLRPLLAGESEGGVGGLHPAEHINHRLAGTLRFIHHNLQRTARVPPCS